MAAPTPNPAEFAANEAFAALLKCIDSATSFRLEAGAGAGKTHSLVEALRYLIKTRGKELLRNHQRIACITYTNVATEEIASRVDRHPAILASTIHAFLWSVIRDFQPFLREEIAKLESWKERLEEAGGVGKRSILYTLGHTKVEDDTIFIHHNDVLIFAASLLDRPKFRRLLTARFPIILIDEYQDTDKNVATAITTHLLGSAEAPLIGFFGDHWQKIYGTGCGLIEHPLVTPIGKRANFRSAPVIVSCLNRMRPELTQEVKDPESIGSVEVFHTNSFTGKRQTGGHWGDDLPSTNAHDALAAALTRLARSGWDTSPAQTKILMLTHNVLAKEQGYAELAAIFPYNDSFLKLEDPYVAFFHNVLEPVCEAYQAKQYGKMFESLGRGTPTIQLHAEKGEWAHDLDALLRLRERGTIGEVLAYLQTTKRPRLPTEVQKIETQLASMGPNIDGEQYPAAERASKLHFVPYQQAIALVSFVRENTPFSTQHGVKGAEFENVLVVLGRGWNQYNFNQLLEWVGQVPADKNESYERNRNLFYVACSRPKRRLALLFTQKLSAPAISTLEKWFGKTALHDILAAT